MKLLERDQEQFLSVLVDLTGDPTVVQEALRQLSTDQKERPTVEAILQRIVELVGGRQIEEKLSLDESVTRLVEARNRRQNLVPSS